MAYRFDPPPGWQVADGFTPGNDWRPNPRGRPHRTVDCRVAVPDAPLPPPPHGTARSRDVAG